MLDGPSDSTSARPLPAKSSAEGGWYDLKRDELRGTRTTFADGAAYMQFTEAVARSSRHQSPVDLPLVEFSNPSL